MFSLLGCLLFQADGVALLCACLKYWLSRESGCPHILVSTHFHNIQHYLAPDEIQQSQLKYQVKAQVIGKSNYFNYFKTNVSNNIVKKHCISLLLCSEWVVVVISQLLTCLSAVLCY